MIQAKVIADSICPRGNRLTTLEVIMPRYILAEYNTHRMLTRNSASSRAIPLRKMILSVLNNTFIPYAWQKDHKGMQGTEYLDSNKKYSFLDFTVEARKFLISEKDSEEDQNQLEELHTIISQKYDNIEHTLEEWWLIARDNAIELAVMLNIFGLTKQLANRLLEPFIYHKVLVSATEWENFFSLRCPQYSWLSNLDKGFKSRKQMIDAWTSNNFTGNIPNHNDILGWLKLNKGQADIHMMFLAESIYGAMNESAPTKLEEGQWHIPYGDQMNETEILFKATQLGILPVYETLDDYSDSDWDKVYELIRKISVSRCARLSYQTLGDNPVIDYEADLKLYDTLASSGHFSPFEHVAKVMTTDEYFESVKGKRYQDGSDEDAPYRMELDGCGWIYNFRGFIQERYLLEQSWKSLK